MARKLILVQPDYTTGRSGATLVALEDIPEEIKQEVEDAYVQWRTNPTTRIRAEFDGDPKLGLTAVDELKQYVTYVTSYVAQRPDTLGGPLRYRKAPTRGLPDNVMDYRITDLKTDNEEATEQVREAVQNVKAARKATAPVATFAAPEPVKATRGRSRR